MMASKGRSLPTSLKASKQGPHHRVRIISPSCVSVARRSSSRIGRFGRILLGGAEIAAERNLPGDGPVESIDGTKALLTASRA